MAASATDKYKKVARKWVGQIGAGGVADAVVTTVPLASTTNIPTDTGIELVIDRVDSNGTKTPTLEETVVGVVSGSNLTSVTRGVEGTAQAHSAGAVVEMLITADGYNDIIDGILVDHDQSGQHKNLTDANGNEWIKQTATASAVNEITLANAATGNSPTVTASGGDTNIGFDLKMKGTGKFRKPTIIEIPVFAPGTNTATGDGKALFRVPEELNGMNLTGVAACVYTAGTTGTTDIQIRNVTDSQDMLSTKITIDSTEVDTSTAATPAVINTSYDDVATADRIAIDVDAISTTAAKGLIVQLRFELPA